MFRWFKEGQSIVWIKSQLDKEGVLAQRGKLFTTGSINVLLQNTHHIGCYNWTDKKSGETILRKSLGVLLATESDFLLRRVGSGTRMTFTHLGEQWLDKWMEANAFVCWVQHSAPWELEDELLSGLSLPLNIKGNSDHLFADELSRLRKEADRQAKEFPVANESNQQRRM